MSELQFLVYNALAEVLADEGLSGRTYSKEEVKEATDAFFEKFYDQSLAKEHEQEQEEIPYLAETPEILADEYAFAFDKNADGEFCPTYFMNAFYRGDGDELEYNVYDAGFHLLDGGIYDDYTLNDVILEVMKEYDVSRARQVDADWLSDKASEVEMADLAEKQREYAEWPTETETDYER
jgi:hypothetical protein